MESASVALPDLDGLNVAELQTLLRNQHATMSEQHAALVAKDEQLVAKDAELLSHQLIIESLKLQILKLRRLQFGQRSEKRAHEIEQLELWVEELETADAQLTFATLAPAVSSLEIGVPKARRVFPAHLPRETQIVAPR